MRVPEPLTSPRPDLLRETAQQPDARPASRARSAITTGGSALLVLDLLPEHDGARAAAAGRDLTAAIPVIAGLLARARAAGVPVIYTSAERTAAGAGDAGSERTGNGAGAVDLAAITPAATDLCIARTGPSAFDDSPLESLLLERGVDEIVLVGASTEAGVMYTAVDASFRDFRVIVPTDAVAGSEPSLASAALNLIRRDVGAHLTTAESIAFVRGEGRAVRRPEHPRRRRTDWIAEADPPEPSQEAKARVRIRKQRQRLVDALGVVIARTGYSAVKVSDITSEARMSLRTFYECFEAKERCFLELHRQTTGLIDEAVRASVHAEQPLFDTFRAAIESWFEILMRSPRLTEALVLELSTLGDECREAREEAIQSLARMLSDLVESGRRAHPELGLHALDEPMARAIVAAVEGLATSHRPRASGAASRDSVTAATGLLVGAIGAPADQVGSEG